MSLLLIHVHESDEIAIRMRTEEYAEHKRKIQHKLTNAKHNRAATTIHSIIEKFAECYLFGNEPSRCGWINNVIIAWG